MKLKPIINSLLETDMYKLSMGQAIFHQFTSDTTKWAFRCRNKDVIFTEEMVSEIREQIDHYCSLKFTDDELEWLGKNIRWLRKDYIDFLKLWHPDRSLISVNETGVGQDGECGLAIEASGTWLNTSPLEIPILAIVNEVYFSLKYGPGALNDEFKKRTVRKFEKIFNHDAWEYLIDNEDCCCNNRFSKLPSEIYQEEHPYDFGTFSEFGLRRRYSGEMQDWLVKYIVENNIPGFVGTSNVYLAKKYGVKPIGTMAHEFATVVGQSRREYNPAYCNRFAMESWVKEYGVLNGIYLTDLVTTDCFLKDFNLTYATLFSGVRHDSGDPIEWGEKMISHYMNLGINPATKTLLFSDSLDFERATKIRERFDGRCDVAFGIGTYLSNPLDKPLNIVMKVVEANGSPVCKLSDAPGKSMCRDSDYVSYLKRCIEWRLANDNN